MTPDRITAATSDSALLMLTVLELNVISSSLHRTLSRPPPCAWSAVL